MATPAVRDAIHAVLHSQWTATPWFDLSDYVTLADLPVDSQSSVLLLQFAFSMERMATIAQPDSHGWQQTGVFYFHILVPAGDVALGRQALMWGEDLRAMFRAKRFGQIIVESVDPFTDLDGAAIRLDGKWHGFSAPASYYSIICA